MGFLIVLPPRQKSSMYIHNYVQCNLVLPFVSMYIAVGMYVPKSSTSSCQFVHTYLIILFF